MDTDQPLAADIQIVEADRTTDDTTGRSLILPNRLRINGQSVATASGSTIKVEGTNLREQPTVTVTLLARRLTIGAAGDLDETAHCGEECSEGHTYAGRCEQAGPTHTHPPYETCDGCQGVDPEHPKPDAAPRREVVAKALNGRDAASDWGEISERTRAIYLSRADAVLAALDVHDSEVRKDVSTCGHKVPNCAWCADIEVRPHVAIDADPAEVERIRSIVREEIRRGIAAEATRQRR